MIDSLKPYKSNEITESTSVDLPVKTQEYLCQTATEAFERVINGDGLAVVESVGFSEEERLTLHDNIVNGVTTRYVTDTNKPGVLLYTARHQAIKLFDDKLLAQDVNTFLSKDYVAANGIYNIYGLNGEASFPPHYDLGNTMGFVEDDNLDENELITIVYTNFGYKYLQAWPEGEDENSHEGFLIEQKPDNMIVLRGGGTVLRPAIRHAVPATTSHCNIITFDLMPKHLFKD